MANYYVDGTKSSTLYGSSNCKVLKENLSVTLVKDENHHFAKYKVTYEIESKTNQQLNLIFIGLGLTNPIKVLVNNEQTLIRHYDSENPSNIAFSLNDSINVNEEDLMYFDASVIKGKNIIVVEYEGELEHDGLGFLTTYKFEYSLYPSKFWESFGTIDFQIALDENFEISKSNIGQPKVENNIAKWQINEINVDTIQLEISTKISLFSRILLFFKPLGIAIIALFIMFIINLRLFILNDDYKNFKYKITLSTIIVPIFFYYIYFKAYDLIDYSLGQENSKHGYVFLFVFTLPLLMVMYGLVLNFFNKKYKKEF
jgi:hypothetical protein